MKLNLKIKYFGIYVIIFLIWIFVNLFILGNGYGYGFWYFVIDPGSFIVWAIQSAIFTVIVYAIMEQEIPYWKNKKN